MTRGALVIKTYGDPEIAGAIVDGMTRKVIPLNDREYRVVRAELARLRACQGVRKYRQERDWHITQMELERKYGTKPRSNLYKNFLMGYAFTCLLLEACWRKLTTKVRRNLR